MKKLMLILIILVVLALTLMASGGLQCYKIGWDLKVKRAYCWSSEFIEEPIPPPTSTYTPIPTWTPEPTAIPTVTISPEPYPGNTPYP